MSKRRKKNYKAEIKPPAIYMDKRLTRDFFRGILAAPLQLMEREARTGRW